MSKERRRFVIKERHPSTNWIFARASLVASESSHRWPSRHPSSRLDHLRQFPSTLRVSCTGIGPCSSLNPDNGSTAPGIPIYAGSCSPVTIALNSADSCPTQTHLQPPHAVRILNERIHHIRSTNSDVADWLQVFGPQYRLPVSPADTLQERRRIEDVYAQSLRKLASRPLGEENLDLGYECLLLTSRSKLTFL